MSGIDYYSLNGYISTDDAGGGGATEYKTDIEFPTAPMYRDIETYSGRCALWLKRFSFGDKAGHQSAEMRVFLENTTPALVLKGVSALNQINLKVNNGANYPDASDPLTIANGEITTANGGYGSTIIMFNPNRKHLIQKNASVETRGDYAFRNAATSASVLGGTGDGSTGNAPASSILIDNAKFFSVYENDSVGNPATALIVNNLWWSKIEIELMGQKDDTFHAGRFKKATGMSLDMSFELIVQPLKNEPTYE